MRLILCLFIPPIGILTIRGGSFWLCFFLGFFGVVPGSIYALIHWTKRNDHKNAMPHGITIVNNMGTS